MRDLGILQRFEIYTLFIGFLLAIFVNPIWYRFLQQGTGNIENENSTIVIGAVSL